MIQKIVAFLDESHCPIPDKDGLVQVLQYHVNTLCTSEEQLGPFYDHYMDHYWYFYVSWDTDTFTYTFCVVYKDNVWQPSSIAAMGDGIALCFDIPLTRITHTDIVETVDTLLDHFDRDDEW